MPPDPFLPHARAIVAGIFGEAATRAFPVRYWTGDVEPGVEPSAAFAIHVRGPAGLRRMLFPPSELSIVEAVISGDLDIEGDIERAMWLGDAVNARLRHPSTLLDLARHLVALPVDDDPREVLRKHAADQVVAPAGEKHAPERDRAAIRYHYDVGNDFYALWLDERMVYSCAYFARGDDPVAELDDAQRDKLDLVCTKLRLEPGMRLLDVGCGWGALVMHAAREYGVRAVGITLSDAQVALARERIARAGLGDRVQVEIRDYRNLASLGQFDRIASIGMVEHVGVDLLPVYFGALHGALRAGGLLLNHGIVSLAAAHPRSRWDWIERRLWKRDAFIEKHVFPDARLGPFSAVIAAAEATGFETRDVESLREHYALTLRAWTARLRAREAEAIAIAGERVYRTWRLYLAASAYGFASGRLNVVQTLLGKPTDDGRTELPLRHARWL